MKSVISIFLLFATVVLGGCASKCWDGKIIQGTDSTVVQVSYNENNKKIKVSSEFAVVRPGYRLVLVGPDGFKVILEKNPILDRLEYQDNDGVIIIPIPEKLDRDSSRSQDHVLIKYDVVVKDVRLDPYIKIITH